MTEGAGIGTLTAASVSVNAVNAVVLTGANDLTTGALAAKVTGSGQGFTFNAASTLTIGSAGGVTGITTNAGTITVTTTDFNMTVNQNVAAGAGAVNLTVGGTNAHVENEMFNNAAISGNTVTLTADRMVLDAGTINTGGTAATDIVILDRFTHGRGIDLGPTDDAPGTLHISQAEVATITAGELTIGSFTAGTLFVEDPVNLSSFASAALLDNGLIGEAGAGGVTATNLDVSATLGVDMEIPTNTITGALAGGSTRGSFAFTNLAALTIGTANGVSGITTNGHTIGVTVNTGLLTFNQAITSGNAEITLTADSMAINAAINAGNHAVVLTPHDTARTVDLGTQSAGNLGLTAAELNLVTAAFLDIGTDGLTPYDGTIQVTNTINGTGHFGGMFLTTGGSITDNGSGLLEVTQLDMLFQAGGVGSQGHPVHVQVTGVFADSQNNSNIFLSATGTATIVGRAPASAGSPPARVRSRLAAARSSWRPTTRSPPRATCSWTTAPP